MNIHIAIDRAFERVGRFLHRRLMRRRSVVAVPMAGSDLPAVAT